MVEKIIDARCKHCGSTLVKVKDKEYYGCPNWKPGGQGCDGDIYDPRKSSDKYPAKMLSYKAESKSRPGHYYLVKLFESGDFQCPCYAGEQQKLCRHQKEMITKMAEVMAIIKERYLTKNE